MILKQKHTDGRKIWSLSVFNSCLRLMYSSVFKIQVSCFGTFKNWLCLHGINKNGKTFPMPGALKLGNRYAKVFPDPVAEIPHEGGSFRWRKCNAGRTSILVVLTKIPIEKCWNYIFGDTQKWIALHQADIRWNRISTFQYILYGGFFNEIAQINPEKWNTIEHSEVV